VHALFLVGVGSQPFIVNCAAAPSTLSWFYSPGFGGIATLLAAIVAYTAVRHQAAATKEASLIQAAEARKRDVEQRDDRNEAVRRDVRIKLESVFSACNTIFDAPNDNSKSASKDAFKEFRQRVSVNGEDLPQALTDEQLGITRSTAGLIQVMPRLWKTTPTATQALAEGLCMVVALNMIMLDPNHRLVAEPSATLTESKYWDAVRAMEGF
jgi:hypothetical protein